MKKRLLFVLVIGVSFAPSVWANQFDGFDDFNTFKRPNDPIQIDCQAGGVSRETKHYASEDKSVAVQKSDKDTDSGIAD